MSIDRLVRKLEQEPQTVDELLAGKRQEWIGDVLTLMRTIADWLRPAVEKQLARIEFRSVAIEEPDTAPYDVAALTIHLGKRQVLVEPRGMRVVGATSAGGTRIVGARGRVELVSGPSRATILRLPNRDWQLAKADGWSSEKGAVPLTQETLTEALAELID